MFRYPRTEAEWQAAADRRRGSPLVDLLAQKKIAVNLTLVVNELIYHTDDLSRVLPEFERKEFHPDVFAVYESQLRASAAGWTPEDYERAPVTNIRAVHRVYAVINNGTVLKPAELSARTEHSQH